MVHKTRQTQSQLVTLANDLECMAGSGCAAVTVQLCDETNSPTKREINALICKELIALLKEEGFDR